MDREALLADLDDEQRLAVLSPASPLCILAPAGSGKTRVLTRRIARRVIDGDADPSRLLAVTFTRKAAAELRRRLSQLGIRDHVAAGTFHGIAYAQLRQRFADMDRRPPALLERRWSLLMQIAGDEPSARELGEEISWAKARMVEPAAYENEATRARRDPRHEPTRIAERFAHYEQEKHRRHVVDLDDLLLLGAQWVREDESFAQRIRWKVRHVFVDEFQDVNPAQHHLLEAWLGGNPDLCVVGDPNQAIYGWNGAEPQFLHQFERRFPGGETVELRTNYRSTPEVLRTAVSVLPHEAVSRGMPAAIQPEGPSPVIRAYDDEASEARAVARSLRHKHGEGLPWRQMAVLARTNAQLGEIESALQNAGIPCRKRARRSLAGDREVIHALAALRSSRHATKFDAVLAELTTMAAEPGAVALAHLAELAEEYAALDPRASLEAFAIWLTAEAPSNEDLDVDEDAVELATFHRAKGLEWSAVYLVGVEDGLVPMHGSADHDEERRLLHVAITRAKRHVVMSWARRRKLGRRKMSRRISPFLTLEPEAERRPELDLVALENARAKLPPRQADALLDDLEDWRRTAARAARTTPDAILSRRALRRIAAKRPADAQAFREVAGVGPLTARHYAEPVLAIVNRHRFLDASEGSSPPVDASHS